jgi:hypothetical protein
VDDLLAELTELLSVAAERGGIEILLEGLEPRELVVAPEGCEW